eukprot:GHVL01022402.1.p2 GENE.GHVL01022402.1~~GHVL01022402.1.p2  ORF type:complete len:709 (+),score=112.44 GHVL01022402.1:84-2210(+)
MTSANTDKRAPFSIPLVGNEDILNISRDLLGVPLTAAQMEKPTAELVKQIYVSSLEQFWDMPKEDLAQMSYNSLRFFESPEIYSEAVPFLVMIRHLQKFLSTCGITDFRLQDMSKPEPKRLKRHISAMLNFARFRQERELAWAAVQDERDEVLLAHSRMTEKVEKSKEELQSLRSKLEVELQDVQECRKKIADTEHKMEQVDRGTEAAKQQVGMKVENFNALDSRVREEDDAIRMLREEIKFLQTQIVHSPDQLRQHLHEIKACKLKENSALEQLANEHTAASDTVTLYQNAEQVLLRVNKKQKALAALYQEFREAQKRAEEKEQHLSMARKQMEENKRKVERLDKCLDLQIEQAKQQEKWFQQQQSEMKQCLTTAESFQAQRKAQLDQLEKQCEEKTKQNNEAKRHIQSITSEHKKEMTSIVNACETLLKALPSYARNLEDHLTGSTLSINATPVPITPTISNLTPSNGTARRSGYQQQKHKSVSSPLVSSDLPCFGGMPGLSQELSSLKTEKQYSYDEELCQRSSSTRTNSSSSASQLHDKPLNSKKSVVIAPPPSAFSGVTKSNTLEEPAETVHRGRAFQRSLEPDEVTPIIPSKIPQPHSHTKKTATASASSDIKKCPSFGYEKGQRAKSYELNDENLYCSPTIPPQTDGIQTPRSKGGHERNASHTPKQLKSSTKRSPELRSSSTLCLKTPGGSNWKLPLTMR